MDLLAFILAISAEGITDEQVQTALNAYIAEHPEAVTTVTDGSITKAKLHDDLAGEIEQNTADVGGLKSAININIDLANATEHFYISTNGTKSTSTAWNAVIINDLTGIAYIGGILGRGTTEYLGIAFYNSETQDSSTFISGVTIVTGEKIGAKVPSSAKSCAIITRPASFADYSAWYYYDSSMIPLGEKAYDFIDKIKGELIDTQADVSSTGGYYVYYNSHQIETSSNMLSYEFVNNGYTKIKCKAAAASSELSIISFFSGAVSTDNYIGGVQSVNGINEYTANIPNNCKLIVVSNRTANLATPEITLYSKIDSAIKALNNKMDLVEEFLMMNEIPLSMGRYNSQNVGIIADDYSMATEKMVVSGEKTLVYVPGTYDVRVYFFADLVTNSTSYTEKISDPGLRIVNNPAGANYYSVVIYNPNDSTADLSQDQIDEIENGVLIGQLNDFIKLLNEYINPNETGANTILKFNQDREQLLSNFVWPINPTGGSAASNAGKMLTFLHFSDIHADGTNLSRVMDYYNAHKTIINDVLFTGDYMLQKFSESFTWWTGVEGTGKILGLIGNHDASDSDNDNYATDVTQQAMYEKFFYGISTWGCTYEQNKTWWYKDYSTQGIRLIGLNSSLDSTNAAAQLSWLENVLASAKTNSLDVCIAIHFPVSGTKIDSLFTTIDGAAPSSHCVSADVIDAVDDFIEDGGNFICYITGHTHSDYMLSATARNTQIAVTVTTAKNENGYYGDQARKAGTRSNDAFNLISIDKIGHTVKLIRIGANCDHYVRPRNTLAINYLTGNIVSET